MASDYGLSFGFRRSDESMRSGTEGRLKVPAAGTFFQGDLVTFDPANPGFLKKAAANDPILAGYTGLLIQEEGWDASIYEAGPGDSYTRGRVRNGRLAAIWTGAGIKVWMKNVGASTRADGRSITERTILTATGLAVGDLLAWDGAKYVETGSADAAVGRVTLTNATDYAEAVLLQ
jgi:hypothetical protein